VTSPSSSAATEARRRAEGGRGGKLRVVLVVVGVLGVLTVPFVRTTMSSSAAFSEYRRATLHDPASPPRWAREQVDPDGCIDEGIAWLRGCEGIQSWCEAELPVVVEMCLASQDRTPYCADVGDQIMSTRFGFEACKARREGIADKYAARHHKKACAAAYRAVARHCERQSREPQ
jgi:hypothetical protein